MYFNDDFFNENMAVGLSVNIIILLLHSHDTLSLLALIAWIS